jgi:hypothetical protein
LCGRKEKLITPFGPGLQAFSRKGPGKGAEIPPDATTFSIIVTFLFSLAGDGRMFRMAEKQDAL